MKRFLSLALAASFAICSLTGSANAATVEFAGTFLTGGGGIFGDVDSAGPLDFTLAFDIADGPGPNTNAIGPGTLVAGTNTLNVTGGQLNLIEDGTDDDAVFQIQTAGGTGISAFTFTGDFFTDTAINQGNLDGILGSSSGFVFFDVTNAAIYQGRISAVPEPTMGLASLGLALGLVAVRRRRQ